MIGDLGAMVKKPMGVGHTVGNQQALSSPQSWRSASGARGQRGNTARWLPGEGQKGLCRFAACEVFLWNEIPNHPRAIRGRLGGLVRRPPRLLLARG